MPVITVKNTFTFISNYRRHNMTHHEKKTKQYQCWHCPKTFVRNDNARKHSLRVHGDQERRTVEVTTRNKKWTPTIFRPGPWNPPPEARTRATIYRIEIPGGKIISQINSSKCKRRISRMNPYLARTPEEALVTLELKKHIHSWQNEPGTTTNGPKYHPIIVHGNNTPR